MTSGLAHVRPHIRSGQPVAAHVRANGARAASSGAEAAAGGLRFSDLPLRRVSLLDDDLIVFASGRRRQGGTAGGADAGAQDTRRPTVGSAGPRLSARSQELADFVAPDGQPVGIQLRGAESSVRTLPGGLREAEAMLRRLISGRGAVDITPRAHNGRLYRLDDGSIVGPRPAYRSGGPSLDINIPGFDRAQKIHFTD